MKLLVTLVYFAYLSSPSLVSAAAAGKEDVSEAATAIKQELQQKLPQLPQTPRRRKKHRRRRLSGSGKGSGKGYFFQTPVGNQLGFIGNDGFPAGVFPLAKCRGDCDDHFDCAGALVCLERDRRYNANDPVPGCTGSTFDNVDVCVAVSDLKVGTHYYIHNQDCTYDVYLPLQKCWGDCDKDSDCAGATSKCYQRDKRNFRVPVPGCSGSTFSIADYCYEPSDIPTGRPVYIADGGRPRDLFPLKKCQGDCDRDSDCAGNLICYNTSGRDTAGITVPGCGNFTPQRGVDYCIDPSDTSVVGLAECVGDCDYDGECRPNSNFICMQRDRYLNSHGDVFGCTGAAHQNRRTDFCIDRRKIPANRLYYRANDKDRPHLFPLGKCEGDCDKDSDCAGSLRCFQRSGTASNVPGCVGPADPNMDYCY